MEPIGYWVFPKINWSFTYPRRATEKHKMQLCNRLQFWIMQLPKAWYEMFYGLRSVQGISMFKCKSRCWEWRRSWWPVMRLHNWRLNANELRKILMSVGYCLFVCLWGLKCFTSTRKGSWISWNLFSTKKAHFKTMESNARKVNSTITKQGNVRAMKQYKEGDKMQWTFCYILLNADRLCNRKKMYEVHFIANYNS